MRTLLFAALAVVSVGCSLPAQHGDTPAGGRNPIAVLNGEKIYEDDITSSIQGELQRLRAEEYDLKRRAVEDAIHTRLLEAEAKRQGITTDQLLEKNVTGKLAEPTEAEMRTRYGVLKDRINRPYEEIAPQLKQAMMKQKGEQSLSDYLSQLREKAKVEVLLDPPRQQVEVDEKRLLGSKDAPVTIVEFSDYECPFCVRVQPTVKELREKYKGQVAWAYRDFPLQSIHPRATRAAAAARCAAEQGKFWEYHSLLFENRNLEEENLRKYAASASLEMSKFEQCLESGRFEDEILKDMAAGAQLGVNGTPAFFINGILISGAQPKEAFEQIIDAELARAKRDTKGGD